MFTYDPGILSMPGCGLYCFVNHGWV